MTFQDQIARYGRLPLALQPELGQCNLTVGEILALAPGSVIKLSKLLGEKIDIHVAGVQYGSGELVRMGGVLSIRVSGFNSADGE